MNNRAELLLAEISAAGQIGPDEIKELRSLVGTQIMKKFLCSYLVEADDALTALGNQDFTTPEGVKKAQLLQSKANILTSLVESVVDLVTTEQAPEPKEGEPANVN